MKQLRLLLLSILFLALVSFQNCSMLSGSQIQAKLTNGEFSSQALMLQSNAMKVLQNRCVSCHNSAMPSGGVDYITDVNSLLYYGLVIPGEPQISPLYQLIQTGVMPPTTSLKSSESQAIYDWILSGFTSAVDVTTPGTGATLTSTFTSINNLILKPKCLGCHNAGNSQGGVNYASYATTLNTVVKGNIASSSLYATISSGIMPKNGTRLSATEVTAVRNWIVNNAPNN